MKVLSVSSEVFPLVKTGGLGDVAGALPPALAPLGVSMRTLLPGYKPVLAQLGNKASAALVLDDVLGHQVTILSANHAGLDLLVAQCPVLYERDGGPYSDTSGTDHADNWLRFAVFCKVAQLIAGGALQDYRPDIVHAHDWQAALALAYLRYGEEPAQPGVMTVHNLAFQGQFGAGIFGQLGLPQSAWSVDGVEYYGTVGYLKAGLQAAAAITTVSPTYAREIRTADFGMGLDGLINARSAVVHGIVNGIDTDVWDPGADEHIAANFTASDFKTRPQNKAALEARFGLSGDGPVFTVVSRLTWQKGMDLLADTADTIISSGVKLAILGSGDKALEGALLAAAARHRGRMGVIIGYDEPLSHLMQAGGDAILIPSRFEPCGLTQLYGLRYGCVPIVARTGGLADTVIDANMAAQSAGVATGFHISPLTAQELVDTVRRAADLYNEPAAWQKLQKNGMATDVSWTNSARQYRDLYQSLLKPA